MKRKPGKNEEHIYTDDGTRIRAADSTIICDTSRGEFDDPEAEKWTRKIILAVNCHDRLVRVAKAHLGYLARNDLIDAKKSGLWVAVEALIAEAEGGGEK